MRGVFAPFTKSSLDLAEFGAGAPYVGRAVEIWGPPDLR